MGFEKFGLLVSIRLVMIMVVLAVAGFLLISPGYPAATLLTLGLAGILTVEVVRYVSKTNQEVARFLSAVRYADFGQRFEFTGLGAGFSELGETFTQILDRFRDDRRQQEGELRHLKALLEHVPVPLISVYADQRIVLWNNAARRLFGKVQIERLADLNPFGADLPGKIMAIQPEARALATITMDGMEQSLSISASEITTASSTERLFSLQNIQTELDGMQLSAWQDLVRVLTHEIMNSITPVTSLAKTAVDLVDDVSRKLSDQSELVAELKDVKDAVNTVARRSDGMMDFVSSYQRLLRLPDPKMSRFKLDELFADVTRMATVDWPGAGLALEARVEPSKLDLYADRQMVEQVLINLLQNSQHALEGMANGEVTLAGRLNKRGHVTIEVTDNGPGIDDDVAARMFVPFYTTRKEGSGVGLALSRQIMNAHGGTISFANGSDGGARFSLAF